MVCCAACISADAYQLLGGIFVCMGNYYLHIYLHFRRARRHAWQDDNGGRQESLLIFRNEHSTAHIRVRGWRALLLLLLFAEGVWELLFWCVQHQVVHYLLLVLIISHYMDQHLLLVLIISHCIDGGRVCVCVCVCVCVRAFGSQSSGVCSTQ